MAQSYSACQAHLTFYLTWSHLSNSTKGISLATVGTRQYHSMIGQHYRWVNSEPFHWFRQVVPDGISRFSVRVAAYGFKVRWCAAHGSSSGLSCATEQQQSCQTQGPKALEPLMAAEHSAWLLAFLRFFKFFFNFSSFNPTTATAAPDDFSLKAAGSEDAV